MTWAMVAVGGGMALSAGSGYASAQSAQNAANKNMAGDKNQQALNMARQALALYGADKGTQWIRANIPRDQLNALFGDQSHTSQSLGGKVLGLGGSGGGLYDSTLGAVPGLFGIGKKHTTVSPPQNNLAAMAATAGPGALGQMSQLGEQQIGAQNAQANAMEGLVGQSRGYGNAMQSQINRDANAQLQQTNALTAAQARGSGIFGSSIQGNQNAGNAARIMQAKQDSLTGLNMGVQNRTMGLQQNVIGQNLSNAASATQLRMNPINTNLAFLQGSTFNPYTPGQYPGVSPIGNAAGSIGNSLSGLGGSMMGQQNLMAAMRQMGYGGASQGTAMSGGAGNAGSIFQGGSIYGSPSGSVYA